MLHVATPEYIRRNVIGGQSRLQGPFGPKPIVYADSTASGKALSFIEHYIQGSVLPFYANTHTEESATGLQTSHFREEARDMIRRTLNAPKEEYAVIFAGSGSTGAMNKLANVFGISPLAAKEEEPTKRAVVFISSFEHHSNELLWRESGNVDCVVIPSNRDGLLDEEALKEELINYSNRDLKLASFSAASNVTGIRTCNTKQVTRILHEHGTLAVWDFAAAGSHTGIDMKGEDLDAVYLSPHKYIGGGAGVPGLLVARRRLFTNDVPTVPGGGTVSYVQPHNGVMYLDDIESREEGGTPAIVESIRCGLVLALHHKVGTDRIEKLEERYINEALKAWKKNDKIVILGNTEVKRVSIVSFLIKSPNGDDTVLHHNFVAALLNDLFGIQARGGCSCAMPYGHVVLGIGKKQSDVIMNSFETLGDAIKAGWVRLSFAYYMPQETINYIIAAVDLVAKHGYKMLNRYALNPKTGSWTYTGYQSCPMKLWDLSGTYSKPRPNNIKDLNTCLSQAKRLLMGAPKVSVERVTDSSFSREFSMSMKESEDDVKDVTWFAVSRNEKQLGRPSHTHVAVPEVAVDHADGMLDRVAVNAKQSIAPRFSFIRMLSSRSSKKEAFKNCEQDLSDTEPTEHISDSARSEPIQLELPLELEHEIYV